MNIPREFVVPKNTDIIFVADLFEEDYIGGAELTTEALYLKAPGLRVFKLHSTSLTPELVEANKEKYWVLFNWTSATRSGLAALLYTDCSYSFVEYDYKYCKYRSSHLHSLREKKECDCHLEKQNMSFALIAGAKSVFFMSKRQQFLYQKLRTSANGNFSYNRHFDAESKVLSSVWKDEDLDFIEQLAKKRKSRPLQASWAVLSGGSWIKNQEATEHYCSKKGLPYELIGNLPYRDFLTKLSEYEGLVFHPAGYDTCPRLVVEAKLLGLELDLNENVQHKDEEWFNTRLPDTTMEYLRTNNRIFWDIVPA